MLTRFSVCCRRHLGLPVFQLRTDLHGLSSAVAQRNIELQADAFVGSG